MKYFLNDDPVFGTSPRHSCIVILVLILSLFCGNKLPAAKNSASITALPPTAVCQPLTAYADANCEATATAIAFDGGSTDPEMDPLTFSISPSGTFPLGTTDVTLTVSDGTETSQCSTTIMVLDTIAPTLNTTDQTITLNDGNLSQTLATADLVSAADNCNGAPITFTFDRELTFDGNDIGTNLLTVTATDASGNEAETTVTVVVTFDPPVIVCRGSINLTLDDECQRTMVPRMVLAGNIGLLDFFEFEITVMDNDPSNGPVVDGCGLFQYSVTSLDDDLDFDTCWGTVKAEDKTPPAVAAIPDDIDLLCLDLDENNLRTLPASVGRCFEVFANDASAAASGQLGAAAGAVVVGTMDAALAARLLAGGDAPVVPIFTDGCAERIEVCVFDTVDEGDDPGCDEAVITRTFTATEILFCESLPSAGTPGTAKAAYALTFNRPTLDDLDENSIEEIITIESCGSDPSVRPAPRPEDYPSLLVGDRTLVLQNGEEVCRIGVTYSDGPSFVSCPNSYKFIRTYTVVDWCAPNEVRTLSQVVKVGDTTAPSFIGPNVQIDINGTLVYGTNAGTTCAAYIRLDDVLVTDNCPGAVSIFAEIFPNGDLAGPAIGAFNVVPGGSPETTSAIPVGTHVMRYTYTDACGNTGVTDLNFRVEDQSPPIAICETGLTISLTGSNNNGSAVIMPNNIDNGSYDDCSAVVFEVARVDTDDLAAGDYAPQLTLSCADAGTVSVGLRVTDSEGSANFCWLNVLVEDKTAPSCIAPTNTTITCVDYGTNLPNDITEATGEQLNTLFGQAVGLDNCGTTVTQTVSGMVNNCGVGNITRQFVSTDDAGFTNMNTCIQRIDVIGVHDYRITLPTDASGDCMEIPAYGEVDSEELACDLITTTTDVDTLRTQLAGEECFKLRVTYDVVNWCAYNSFGEPYVIRRDAPGALSATQDPRDIDEDPLYINVTPGSSTSTINDDVAFYSLIGTDRTFDPSPSPQNDQALGDNGEGDTDDDDTYGTNVYDSRGFFRYTQFIKVYDEVAPEIAFVAPAACFEGTGEGCRAMVTLEFSAIDECSEAVVGVEFDADFMGAFVSDDPAGLDVDISLSNDGDGNYVVTANNAPAGEHAVRILATDGCGNSDAQTVVFCVNPNRPPSPICVQALTVVLMDDGNGGGIASIWAVDFVASPIFDCFGNLVESYSIYRSSAADSTNFVPTAGVLSIDDINCDDFDNETVNVRLYAFDEHGTTPNYCEVVVEVQGDMSYCDDASGILSGLITTQNDEVMEGVLVSLNSSAGMDETTTTDANGAYRFNNLPLGADYTIQPIFDAGFSFQRIRASDLVRGIGHILGSAPFTDAYQFVAADVNRDASFDVFDILAAQRSILGIDDGFTGGNWFMVDAGTEINMDDPYATAFPEVYNANNLQGRLIADFVAIEKMNLTGATGQ